MRKQAEITNIMRKGFWYSSVHLSSANQLRLESSLHLKQESREAHQGFILLTTGVISLTNPYRNTSYIRQLSGRRCPATGPAEAPGLVQNASVEARLCQILAQLSFSH